MNALNFPCYLTNLKSWAFWTCVSQFVVFLFSFLIFSACYNFMILENKDPDANPFISDYEEYFTLASALLLLVPFGLSLFLIFAFLNKELRMLNIWIKTATTFSIIYFCFLLANGIYLAVDGSVYVGYVAIGLSLICCAFMVLSILTIYKYHKKLSANESKPSEEV